MSALRVSDLRFRISLFCVAALSAILFLCAVSARARKLNLPPEATQGLQQMYAGDPDAAIESFLKLQQQRPDNPLGYLLEVDARWWKIYCASCEIKWNLIDVWRRPRAPEDAAYFALADKAIALAETRIAQADSAEMRLYAGMGYALKARLLAAREEKRATARAGVKAREHFLRAKQLDPELADAYTGLGLYNYYVDTLSPIVKLLRFFMGIPGGSRHEGLRHLELAKQKGELTAVEARFYLAKNLRNYDEKYERAAELLEPLVKQYPQNPVFQLLLGDMNAKLNRREKAAASFHAAEKIEVRDSACRARTRQLASAALAALAAPRND